MNDLSAQIKKTIIDYVNTSEQNCLGAEYMEKAWGSPLVGFSQGSDPLYAQFKQAIGEFYWTPEEIFMKTYPESQITPHNLTVICWVIPQTEPTKQDMRAEGVYPSKRAALARVNGETFNLTIGKHLVDALHKLGYQAVAPVLSPYWARKESEKLGLASCWSERHAAYASGLGTFSLTDALITPLGMAVRLGSVIVNVSLEPTKRNYSSFHEYCLFFSTGGCLKCAQRCPAKAITAQGHDKSRCIEYKKAVTAEYNQQHYELDANYCGICQSGTPCESRVPIKLANQNLNH